VWLLLAAQGEFAFVIYDNKHKQAFAARDPSGSESLYYHLGECLVATGPGDFLAAQAMAVGEWGKACGSVIVGCLAASVVLLLACLLLAVATCNGPCCTPDLHTCC